MRVSGGIVHFPDVLIFSRLWTACSKRHSQLQAFSPRRRKRPRPRCRRQTAYEAKLRAREEHKARTGKGMTGRVLLIAYGSPAEIEFLHFFIGAFQAVVPNFAGLPDDPPPLEFQVSDAEVLRLRLTEAGLKDVRVETSAERVEFRSGQEMWNWVLYGNPIPGMLIADLTEEQQATMQQVLDGMLRGRSGDNTATILTSPVNIGIGTK
jgi:hypothetical protein